jgi:hypothetical protein
MPIYMKWMLGRENHKTSKGPIVFRELIIARTKEKLKKILAEYTCGYTCIWNRRVIAKFNNFRSYQTLCLTESLVFRNTLRFLAQSLTEVKIVTTNNPWA